MSEHTVENDAPDGFTSGPMPGSLMPCGCHIRRPDYEAELCAEHLAEVDAPTRVIPHTLALILATITVCAGLFLAGGSAQAASPHTGTATVAGKLCQDRGKTNYYVHHWQHLPAWKILNSKMQFHAHMCRANGFRLYKSNADTAQEANFARRFLRATPPKGDRQWGYKASIYCRTSATSAYFLDLQFYWTSNLHHLDLAERHHYSTWAHKYAAAHGCRLFRAKVGG